MKPLGQACPQCQRPDPPFVLFAVVASNGVRQIRARCLDCGFAGDHNYSYAQVRAAGYDPSSLGVERDNRSEPCVVAGCPSVYAEYHHWAPGSVFPDTDSWPGAYLCVRHHQAWHQQMQGYRWNAA